MARETDTLFYPSQAFGSHSLGFSFPKLNHFRNDADKRDFIAIGTATGVAVAFGAPIGGCLFAVEEGASFYSNTMLWRGFLATCMGVLTIHWLDQLGTSYAHYHTSRLLRTADRLRTATPTSSQRNELTTRPK
jgi:H+/Cl- antiporter ClcA|tara:strand:+ start:46 stop:444 length:399 start_codon:yes stop_codon:yes gene_type:complete